MSNLKAKQVLNSRNTIAHVLLYLRYCDLKYVRYSKQLSSKLPDEIVNMKVPVHEDEQIVHHLSELLRAAVVRLK